MIHQSRLFLVVGLLLPLVVAGCGKKDGVGTVRGMVTYRGSPVQNALVVFMPETPGLLPASGLTDSNGRYELMTSVKGDGASVGNHRVTVTARGPDKGRSDATVDPLGIGGEPGDPLIPIDYFMPDTSGLTAEVKPGVNTVDFALTDR